MNKEPSSTILKYLDIQTEVAPSMPQTVFPEGLTWDGTQGASINDIHKIFGFADPLPQFPHLELICSIKFT